MIRGANFTVDNDKDYKLKQIYKERGKSIRLFECPDNAGWPSSYCFPSAGVRKSYLTLRGRIGQDGEMMFEDAAFHI